MAKPEWGKKRICLACNTKYYDFNKSPIICPSCGSEFDPDIYLKSRKGKNLSTKVVSEKKQNMSEDMTNIDDIEPDTDDEVVSDDDPLLDINTENQFSIIKSLTQTSEGPFSGKKTKEDRSFARRCSS